MKPWMPFQIQSVTSWQDLRRFCSQGFQNLYAALNGKIGFTDNIYCQVVNVSLGAGGGNINHSLGKIPIGFIILNKDANVDFWSSSSFPWTDTYIHLLTTNAVNAKIAIIGG